MPKKRAPQGKRRGSAAQNDKPATNGKAENGTGQSNKLHIWSWPWCTLRRGRLPWIQGKLLYEKCLKPFVMVRIEYNDPHKYASNAWVFFYVVN